MKEPTFLSKLRSKLSYKERTLLKMVLWSCSLVWMVFFLAFGVITAQRLADPNLWANSFIPTGIMTFIAPVWWVFTVMLIIVLMARWIRRKLNG